MMKNKDTKDTDSVKKQTLIFAVIIALCIGFFSGTIYSSFKLVPDKQTQAQATMPPDNNQEQGQQDSVAAKILQLEQYLEKHPEDAQAWAQLGNQFFDSNQFVNAIDAYTKSLTFEPGKIGVITDLGVMYRRNKQPQKAIEMFDKAILLDPKFETARFNKGIVLLHDLNDAEGGIKAWESIVEQNPVAMAPNGESIDALIQRMKQKK